MNGRTRRRYVRLDNAIMLSSSRPFTSTATVQILQSGLPRRTKAKAITTWIGLFVWPIRDAQWWMSETEEESYNQDQHSIGGEPRTCQFEDLHLPTASYLSMRNHDLFRCTYSVHPSRIHCPHTDTVEELGWQGNSLTRCCRERSSGGAGR